MRLISPEFENNKFIPQKFTCEGEDINPTLIIEDIPNATQSLALIMDDPDAPMGTWVHWVVYDIPVGCRSIGMPIYSASRIEENSIPGKLGVNNLGKQVYHGPCPPSGVHRYFFKLYAVDKQLNLKEGMSKAALEKTMQGHILDKAELIGLYKKKK